MSNVAADGEGVVMERQRINKIPISVNVLMLLSEDESRMVKTRDICDAGVFLLMDGPLPEIGEVIRAQVVGLGEGDAPVVELVVRAREADGIECVYRSA